MEDLLSSSRTTSSSSSRHGVRIASAIAVAVTLSVAAFSADTLVFGPQTYTRAAGKRVTVKTTFRISHSSGPYTLRVVNQGVTSAVITLNGHDVLVPGDFVAPARPDRRGRDDRDDRDDGDEKKNNDKDADDNAKGRQVVPLVERTVTLRTGDNQITVELRGRKGTSLTVDIRGASADITPPTLTAVASPAANANGWNNSTVTVTFTCADAGSGIQTCPAPIVTSAEGAHQVVSGTAVDKAGNTATASVTLNIDTTPPIVTATPAPAANANGWNNAPVLVTFAAGDARSGIQPGTLTAPVSLSADGAAQSATGHATDLAGNIGTATRGGINIDRAGPVVTVALTPVPNANGWNSTPVTAHFTCTDAGSGIAACPADQVVATDGANRTVTGAATDLAGNAASISSAAFRIDQTRPTITVALTPPPNANGVHETAVTAQFTCGDAGSGISACPQDRVVSTEGSNQTVTGTTTDRAGNVATVTSEPFTINLNVAPPTIAVSLSPAPNANGWNNGPVAAHFTCTAGVASIASCPPDRVVATDGVNQTVSGTTTDLAGRSASVTSAAFNIDQSQPAITASVSPAPNANGWNSTPIVVSFTCTDADSGVATCPAAVTVTADGANQTITRTASDNAGNTASVTVTLNIDRTKPVITAALTSVATGWLGQPAVVYFTCSDDGGSGIDTCPPGQIVNVESANQTVTGIAIDRAGNSASVTSAPFSIDLSPPSIAVTLSPAPNANGWNNTPVTAHFACTDTGSGIATCPSDQLFAVEGVGQVIVGTAIDLAGNEATTSATINIDLTPPALSLISPMEGATLFSPAITATGSVTDSVSGIAAATCNGIPTAVSGTRLDCVLTLTPGSNSVTAAVTDLAGNTSTATLAFTYTRVPIVTITSPANLSYQNISPTTVSGTVDDPDATIAINSIQTPIVNGQFSLALPLAEGPNIITATATHGVAVGTASLETTLDTTPPHVAITSPPDQFVTSDTSISVTGNVNDIVVGTVNDEQAHVTVNGSAAQVANRTFLATNVALTIGPNVIHVVGADRVGNAATTEITVTRQAPPAAHIELLSGNNQSGAIGAVLAASLVVAVTGSTGAPVANAPVVFKVTQNDGLVAAGGVPSPAVSTTTDAQGHAQARWTLGNRSGAGGNALEAYAVGVPGTAIFTASGTQGAAGRILVDTGNDQLGAIGQAVPRPLIAVVVDRGNNRLSSVPVTFTVQQGGGSFDGQPSVTVDSDSDGRVAATLTLGLQEGNANNLVEASFPSNAGSPATFTASGRTPGNPADTVVSGVVLDNSNIPIPGVIVRAVLTNELHSNAAVVQSAIVAQTDQQGQFTIAQAPVGLVKLLVDGSTAPPAGTYPVLEYDVITVAGQNNTVGQPIYLVALNPANRLCVTATTGGGTLIMADAPGFSLTFAPGQVTFPGGSKDGCVGVTSVHADKIPMAPSFGQQPSFIVTIQPAGAIFNPPAAVSFPNVDGLKPRETTEMFSFDHDIGSFVAIGTGVVTDDGQAIRSSPGVGVLKAGWHAGGPPPPTGDVNSPPPPPPPPPPGPLVTIVNPAPVMLSKEKTVTVAAVGGPHAGTYSWSSSDLSVATVQGSPNGSSVVVRGMVPGSAVISVVFTDSVTHQSAYDSREFVITTADVVIVSWVDASAIVLPDGANTLLRASLNSPIACSILTGNWLIGLPTALFDGVDVNYANAYLLTHSGNGPPPAALDSSSTDALLASGAFRLFNRLQATFSHTGDVISDFSAVKSAAVVGVTPDPCSFLTFAPETHISNGVSGVTFSRTGAYQLAEGRLGSLGQSVSFTINQRTVPWIWSVIRFDAAGALAPLTLATCSDSDNFLSCFPTHWVYVDGRLIAKFRQNTAGFILRDFNYQKYPTQVQ